MGGENRSSVRETSGNGQVCRLKRRLTAPSGERARRTLGAACPQLLVALPEVRPVASFLNQVAASRVGHQFEKAAATHMNQYPVIARLEIDVRRIDQTLVENRVDAVGEP